MAYKTIKGEIRFEEDIQVNANIKSNTDYPLNFKAGSGKIILPYAPEYIPLSSLPNYDTIEYDENTTYYRKVSTRYLEWTTINASNFEANKSKIYIENNVTAYTTTFPQKSGMVVVADSTPTTAGTYKLQCVVDSNGNPTFSWVADN